MLGRTSCHYGHDFHTTHDPPGTRARIRYRDFIPSLSPVRAQKGETCQRKSHKTKANWWPLLAFLLLLFHRPVERPGATGGSTLYTTVRLCRALLTLEILMRRINYSHKVLRQIE